MTTRPYKVITTYIDEQKLKSSVRQARQQAVLICLLLALVLGGVGFYIARDRIEDARGQASRIEKENEQLRYITNKAKDESSVLQEKVKGLNSEFDSLTGSLQNLRSTVNSFNDDYTIWDDVVPQLDPNLREVESRTQGLNDKLNELASQVENLSQTANKTASITVNQSPVEKEKQEITVYVTNTGKKYHRAGCGYLRQSSNPISLKDALSAGYDACSRCY